jgi:hypothetical protein
MASIASFADLSVIARKLWFFQPFRDRERLKNMVTKLDGPGNCAGALFGYLLLTRRKAVGG